MVQRSTHDYKTGNSKGGRVTDDKKPPPQGFSAFKQFLEKLAKVPKAEIDEKEREYQERREPLRKKAR